MICLNSKLPLPILIGFPTTKLAEQEFKLSVSKFLVESIKNYIVVSKLIFRRDDLLCFIPIQDIGFMVPEKVKWSATK